MRYWVQYMTLSTGHVAGSNPPRFDGPKTLIDALGSDAVYPLDGRLSEAHMHRDALRRAQRYEHFKQWAGYRLCKGPRLFDEIKSTTPMRLSYPIQTN